MDYRTWKCTAHAQITNMLATRFPVLFCIVIFSLIQFTQSMWKYNSMASSSVNRGIHKLDFSLQCRIRIPHLHADNSAQLEDSYEFNVWLLTRPLTHPLAFLCQGGAECEHWGVLVSHLRPELLHHGWLEAQKADSGIINLTTCWGQIYELAGAHDIGSTFLHIADFGPFSATVEWKNASRYFIGTTKVSRTDISLAGHFPFLDKIY